MLTPAVYADAQRNLWLYLVDIVGILKQNFIAVFRLRASCTYLLCFDS